MENGGKKASGNAAEAAAAKYLQKKGYTVLARQFRKRGGEIDLICRDGEYLVFVEVKYRTRTDFGRPGEAVNVRKRERIARTALLYMMQFKMLDKPARFDVIEWVNGQMTHIEDAFSAPFWS